MRQHQVGEPPGQKLGIGAHREDAGGDRGGDEWRRPLRRARFSICVQRSARPRRPNEARAGRRSFGADACSTGCSKLDAVRELSGRTTFRLFGL
ncbi:MAG: DUF1403 family protein [Mesorhizobium sp.]|nr:MAG: DUF1403 family protein [Mesorhizobium sp.]